ncbi:hypothetical protein DPM19_31160 [Actinomadura craniellae]|uniref:Uncharacterized protein n=1 Tax=Actinomadura craniellae TaxID=2231787 RepID=A0A365GWL9_9ACTN|nr:hypothetical protein DPM19_31160 [Actinomadura craniellae]
MLVVLMIGASVLFTTSCGGGEDPPSKSVPLPLQSSGLPIGGDARARATDVTETRLTEQQLQEISEACGRTVEITNASQDTCARTVQKTLDSSGKQPCGPSDVCLKFYTSPKGSPGPPGYFEVVDERPGGESQCDSGPGRVCIRVGWKNRKVLEQITAPARPSAPRNGTPPARTTEPAPAPSAPVTEPEEPPDEEPPDEGPESPPDGEPTNPASP